MAMAGFIRPWPLSCLKGKLVHPERFEPPASAFGGQYSLIMTGRQCSKFNMLLSQRVAQSRSSSLGSVPELCHGTLPSCNGERRYDTQYSALVGRCRSGNTERKNSLTIFSVVTQSGGVARSMAVTAFSEPGCRRCFWRMALRRDSESVHAIGHLSYCAIPCR